MLHLQAGVHLQKVKVAVAAIQELHGAGAPVVNCLGRAHGHLAHLQPGGVVQHRAGGLLDDLLVAALHRAVALEQVHGGAVGVRHHLHLHMARVVHELLDVDSAIAESADGLSPGRVERAHEALLALDQAHALAAAARRGLEHHREADLPGHGEGRLTIGEAPLRTMVAGDHRHTGCLHVAACGHLVAHGVDGLGVRADKHNAGVGAGQGELRVLGEEPVPRVDGLGAHLAGGVEHLVHTEVALARRCGPDVHSPVRVPDMQGLPVGVGVHSQGRDSHLPTGPHDADRDLTTVCYKDSLEHGREFTGRWA